MAAPVRLGFSFPAGRSPAPPPRPVPPVRDDVEESLSAGLELGDFEGADGGLLTPEQVSELIQRMLRLSLAFFAAEVVKGDVSSRAEEGDPDDPLVPFEGQTVIADFHLEWERTLREKKKICLLAPRDHGKSHMLTIAFPIWEAWRRPGIEILIISETQPQAERQLAKLKAEIENNPRLQHLMDPSCWSAKKIRFTNGSTILCSGFGSKMRGMHPHVIIADDIVSEAAMYSSLIRDRQYNAFLAAVRNMLVPSGQIIVVGTPQHEDDLYGRLSRNKQWYFKQYRAEFDVADPATGQRRIAILFPERYSRELLKERLEEIGAIRYQREFLTDPTGSGMSLFPDELVSAAPFLDFTTVLGRYFDEGRTRPTRPWWAAHGVDRFYAGVDIASSTNIGSDWFVIFVCGLDRFGNRWVVDIVREQGLGYQRQKALIADTAVYWGCELVCIESNAAQSIYGEDLRAQTSVPLFMHHTGADKHSLEKGIPSLRLLLEQQKYRVPRGDPQSVETTTLWIGELQAFTFTREKGVVSVARHDDIPMAQWHCELAIRRGEAFAFAFGEQPGDKEAAEEEERLFQAPSAAAKEQAPPAAAAQPGTAEDPWVTMGLDPEDLAFKPGRRGNLDYGGVAGVPMAQLPDQPGARPQHPFGACSGLLGLLSTGRMVPR